jgi:hypothetical protein
MSQKIWLTNIIKDYAIGDKHGLRYKYFDDDWRPAQHEITNERRDRLLNLERHVAGYSLDRKLFPEYVAIFDEKCFRRKKEVFLLAGSSL